LSWINTRERPIQTSDIGTSGIAAPTDKIGKSESQICRYRLEEKRCAEPLTPRAIAKIL